MYRIPVFAALLLLTGCYAASKSTLDLAKAEKKVQAARAADAQLHAVYAWTMADEYMKKARDEWGRSDYEAAEALMTKATTWAEQAIQTAKLAPADSKWGTEQLEDAPDAPATEAVPSASPIPGVW